MIANGIEYSSTVDQVDPYYIICIAYIYIELRALEIYKRIGSNGVTTMQAFQVYFDVVFFIDLNYAASN